MDWTRYPIAHLVAGIMMMVTIFGGGIVFVIALMMARKTRKTGWIITAVVSGLPTVFFLIPFLIIFGIAIVESIRHPGDPPPETSTVQSSETSSSPPVVSKLPPVVPKGDGVFIPAMNRVDMVHDPKRNILYITSGDSVLQYELKTRQFLPPLVLGGDLRGIDISPDNNQLAVADAAGGNGRVCIHVVDLQTGKDSPAAFSAEFQESGTFSVAFGADGQIWISSSMNGSGFLPMRKYNPSTHGVQKLQSVSQDTMLAASADHQNIAFAEADVSPGSYGRILYRAVQLPKPMRSEYFLYEIGISRDGSQLAVPGYGSTLLPGSATPKLDEQQVIAAAYHPLRDYLFVARAGTSILSVYDTTTLSNVKEFDFGDQFGWVGNHAYQTGRLKLSQDGKYIFCTVSGGIRYAETGL